MLLYIFAVGSIIVLATFLLIITKFHSLVPHCTEFLVQNSAFQLKIGIKQEVHSSRWKRREQSTIGRKLVFGRLLKKSAETMSCSYYDVH